MDNTMDYGADILTLVDDDGVEHQFEVADTMDYEDHQYMALVPVFDEAGRAPRGQRRTAGPGDGRA